MPLTIMEALATPGFYGASVVGGWAGLDRPVKSATIAEVPDAAAWLDGGEIVFTTGYTYRSDPRGFRDWLESLIRGGAVAVCVKQRRFLGHIPQEAVQMADAFDVPLVALPNHVTWPRLIEPLVGLMLRGPAAPDEFVTAFAELFRARSGFPAVARMLAECFQVPVFIHSRDFHLLGAGVPGARREELKPLLRRRFDASTVRRLYEDLRADVTEPWHGQPGGGRRLTLAGTVEERFHVLETEGGEVGYLSRLDVEPPDPALDHQWRVAVALLAAGFGRFEQDSSLRHVSGRDLFEVLSGLKPLAVLDGRLQRLLVRSGTILVASVGHAEADAQRLASVGWLRGVTRWARSVDLQAAVVTNGQSLVFVVGTDEGKPRSGMDWARALQRYLAEGGPADGLAHAIGVTGEARGVEGYRSAFHQATAAWRVAAARATRTGVVEAFDTLGPVALMFERVEPEELRAFSREILSPVLQSPDGTNLFETLSVFLAVHGQPSEAARRLFIHRNTLRYRLQKVARLTHADPFRSEGYAALYLAWRLTPERHMGQARG